MILYVLNADSVNMPLRELAALLVVVSLLFD